MDTHNVFTVVLAVVSGLLGLVQWFLKSSLLDLKSALADVQKAHSALVERMPREYVMREEFMRIMAGVETKLGAVDGKMDRLLESSYSRIGRDG